MFKTIKRLFDTIISIFSIPFKKLKVFYQILIIVGIMIIFAGIQGVMGVHVINTLTANTKVIYNKSMNLMVGLSHLHENFLKLQIAYSNDVANAETTVRQSMQNFSGPAIASELNNLKSIEPNILETIEENFETLKEIVARPINAENYMKMAQVIFQVETALKQDIDNIQLSTLNAMTEGMNFSNSAMRLTLLLLVVGSIFATMLGFIIARLISKPLRSVSVISNALASGDLTKTIPAKGSVEVVTVVESLNKAITSLRGLVMGINEQSHMLYVASEELKNASNETGRSAMEVAKTMEELARASAEQAEQTNETLKHINTLAELVRQVSNELKNISLESNSVAQSAKLGQKASNDITDGILRIYDMSKNVTVMINELNQASGEIAEISTVIEGISEQTTLLALNAAIEAARAGKHGKGFAVVATETRKLAEQSKEAAQHINNLIIQMKNSSQQAVQAMAENMNIVESGKTMATNATVTFEDIFNKLSKILNRIDSVSVSAKQMAESNETMISAMNNIAALSEEAMASTEEVSATAEEQSASVEEVNALAENLNEISGKLKQSIAQFEIDTTEGAK